MNFLKAAVFLGPRRIRVLDVETPKVASNEVLIKIKNVGICGMDVHRYSRQKDTLRNVKEKIITLIFPLKQIMGHEFSGFVIDKGKNVKNVEVNEKVTAFPRITCHTCNYCKMGLMNLCENERPWPGAFAEYVKVPSENTVKIPKEISCKSAAMLEPLACALHAARVSKVKKYDSVAILGAGTMGLLLLQVLKSFGIEKILVTDILDFKLEVARKLKADITLNPSEVSSQEKKILTRGVDATFVCIGGAASVLNQAIDLAKKRGKINIVGSFFSPPKINMLEFRHKELTMTGSEGFNKEDFLDGIDLLLNGKVTVKPLITHVFPLTKVDMAFETALNSEQTKSIKVQITP